MSSAALKSSLAALAAAAGAVPSEAVEISGGGSVVVRGLTVMQFVVALKRFPEIRTTLLGLIGMAGRDVSGDQVGEIVGALVETGPEAIASLVAVAMGAKADDKGVMDVLIALPDEDLVAILDRVIELTMPRGVSDFFGRFGALARRLGLVDDAPSEPAQAA